MAEHYHFAHNGIAHQHCHVSLAPFPVPKEIKRQGLRLTTQQSLPPSGTAVDYPAMQ